MRLWSLHPKHLDKAGLGAVWREALLAKAVLSGKTRGYTRHPQLQRFLPVANPIGAINSYLLEVFLEATRRGYHYDLSKVGAGYGPKKIPVTEGQVSYEAQHLKTKIKRRNRNPRDLLKSLDHPDVNPLFEIVKGNVEDWERR